jgi:mannose-6-phosphate isomerase-like protein (cupin superfamily)
MVDETLKTNLLALAAAMTAVRTNLEVAHVDGCALRLAVATGEYPWHRHPGSDELFLVLEGELVIELADAGEVVLRPMEIFTVRAGVVHRTRSAPRTINLCVERCDAQTEPVELRGQR